MIEQTPEYKLAILAEKDISDNVSKAIRSTKAHRRWFWELIQNARDTMVDEIDRQVSVKLTYSKSDAGEPTITFEHSGNPFKFTADATRFDDLTNLILPLSGKSPGKTVGKFGTGFLSTHILSLKVRVQGVYLNEKGEYFDFDILIDRTETDRHKLIESIVQSLSEQKTSFRSIPLGTYIPSKNNFRTTKFTYYLNSNKNGTEYALQIVKEGINDLLQVLPFVLNFVREINSVEISDQEDHKCKFIYQKKESSKTRENISVTTISKTTWELDSQTILKCDEISIASMTDDDVEVACEVIPENTLYKIVDFKGKYNKQTEKEFPILFSSFPLIGSEDFKFPLVINSKRFSPNETRDGVELKTNIDGNQTLIDKAVKLYNDFLTQASKDWHSVFLLVMTDSFISSTHDWIDKRWFEEGTGEFLGVLKPIRQKILYTPLVDVLNEEGIIERKAILSDTGNHQIFIPIKENKDKLHKFGKQMFPGCLPVISDLENWCHIVWDDKDFQRINIEFLIEQIAARANVYALAELLYKDRNKIEETINWLYDFYSFIKTDFKDQMSGLFNHVVKGVPQKFIPDRELNFSQLNPLKRDVGYSRIGVVDDILLNLHTNLTGENLKSKLLHSRFSNFLATSDSLTEEQIASLIRDFIESKLKRDDDHSTTFKDSLSKLYDWVSFKSNNDKDYFKEALKNRILSAIMPSEKMKFVTKILELDRNDKITLEKQIEILGTPNIERIIELGKEALEKEDQERVDFEFKSMIGVHIEKLVREKIKTDLSKFEIPDITEKQNGQDIVIIINNIIVYYIEVKSRWDNSRSITMSNAQLKKAAKNKSIYSLCCVEMSDYHPLDGNRHSVSDISLIKNRIKVINEIGAKIEPLVSNALSVETLDDEVKLTDEYRAVIPQPLIVRDGISLDSFVDHLILALNLNSL